MAKRGRPRRRGRPPKGVATKKKEIQDLLDANSVITNGIEGAYGKKNPGSSKKSVVMNSWRILSKEVKQHIRDYLSSDLIAQTNKENLEKFYQLLIALFIKKDPRVRAADVRACLADLSKLCPEFKDQLVVTNIPYKEEELDKQINDLVEKFKTGQRSVSHETKEKNNPSLN